MNKTRLNLTAAFRAFFVFIALFTLGAGIRLFDVSDEPLEFHPTRQLRSAIIARAIYYEDNPAIPEERVEFALNQAAQTGLIEPPVLEYLTAAAYRQAGGELVWLGRLFSVGFWLLGGLALYDLAARFSGRAGGITALLFYLFLPFGVIASRALMPDPLMVSLTVAAVWALTRWEERHTLPWAVTAGVITGLALLVKSVAGIILLPAYAAFILSAFGFKPALKDKQVWALLALAALPSAAYYYYGIVIDGRLAEQFSGRFFPQLYVNPAFYVNWLLNIETHFGLIALVMAAAGMAVAPQDKARWLLTGWWAGYLLYGFLFPYHTWTHSYYHLPLVPIMALSLAPLGGRIAAWIEKSGQGRFSRRVILAALAVWVAFNIWTVRDQLEAVDYRLARARWERIGETLGELPGPAVALTDDYENSLNFYGFAAARHWPAGGDQNYRALSGGAPKSFQQTWADLAAGARYFLVTDFEELDGQPELRGALGQYPVYRQGEGYVIYELAGP